MTRVAKPAPKVPESGTQFVAKPLMLKKSEIEKQKQRQKRKAQEEEDRKRTQTNYGQDSANAPKRHRSENAKNKRNEKRREFRKIEKEKNFTCFLCRQKGHSVKNCPKASEAQVGVCYRCGSDEHTTKDCSTRGKSFAFATCFVCGGQGHLASKCEKNDKGLYPDGGGCKYCGSTQHLAKDCKPTRNSSTEATVGTVDAKQGGDDDDVFAALRMQQQDKTKHDAEPKKPMAKKPKRVVARF